jgi:hypothetical protein
MLEGDKILDKKKAIPVSLLLSPLTSACSPSSSMQFPLDIGQD